MRWFRFLGTLILLLVTMSIGRTTAVSARDVPCSVICTPNRVCDQYCINQYNEGSTCGNEGYQCCTPDVQYCWTQEMAYAIDFEFPDPCVWIHSGENIFCDKNGCTGGSGGYSTCTYYEGGYWFYGQCCSHYGCWGSNNCF